MNNLPVPALPASRLWYLVSIFHHLIPKVSIFPISLAKILTLNLKKRTQSQVATKLKAGDKAPDFAVPDAEGNTVRLKDLRGKKFVLYFYPKDDTPGCTKEACSFRDSFAKFKRRGIEVFGVSLDSEKSHQKFARKFELPFRLLADTERKLSESFGTYGEKKFMGRTYLGNHRMTFLIDEKGKIKKVFEKVKPEDHAEEVLSAFNE
jgi:peroxiredoxin Q/BCP